MDATLHATVCKHAHVITILKTRSAVIPPKTTVCEVEYFVNILKDYIPNNKLENVRKQVIGKISELTVLVTTCQNMDALKTSSNHLTSAIVTIKALQRNSQLQTGIYTH